MTDSDISNMLCNFADLQLCYTCPEEVNKTKAWQLLDTPCFKPNLCSPYPPTPHWTQDYREWDIPAWTVNIF